MSEHPNIEAVSKTYCVKFNDKEYLCTAKSPEEAQQIFCIDYAIPYSETYGKMETREPKKPMGRPPKQNDEIMVEICRLAALGLPYIKIADAVSIHKDTLYEWLKDEDFSDLIKKAKALRFAKRIELIESMPDRWQAISCVLERTEREDWRPPTQVNDNTHKFDKQNAKEILEKWKELGIKPTK